MTIPNRWSDDVMIAISGVDSHMYYMTVIVIKLLDHEVTVTVTDVRDSHSGLTA